jgi:Protein of unknown function (DUF1176)
MKTAIWAILSLAIGLASAAKAQEVKPFKAWLAVCDNLKTCAAYGFAPDDADSPGYVKLSRAAGPNASPRVVLQVQDLNGDDKAGLKWKVSVDGAVVPGLSALATKINDQGPRAELAGDQAEALIAAIRNGSTLTLSSGAASTAISLSGAAASLLWIDDSQGRVGTVTALGAHGTKPASAVPPAPAEPTVRAAALASQARLATKLPASIAKAPGMSDCDTGDDHPDPFIARLGVGQVLWAPVCSEGAYNLLYLTFVGDETGGHLQVVRLPPAIATAGDDDGQVMNLDYDAKTGVISSFAKGRGLGDCGEQTSWVWDGKAFRVVDDSTMPDCHGVTSDDWPSVYHATVSR